MVQLSHPYMTAGKTITLTIMSEKKNKQAIERNMLLYQLEKHDSVDVDTLTHV